MKIKNKNEINDLIDDVLSEKITRKEFITKFKNVNVKYLNNNKTDILNIFVMKGFKYNEISNFLIKFGVSVNNFDKYRYTPIMWGAATLNHEIIELIINKNKNSLKTKKENLNKSNPILENLLMLTLSAKSNDIVEKMEICENFIENNLIDFNGINIDGYDTVFCFLIFYIKNLKIIYQIKKQNNNQNIQDNNVKKIIDVFKKLLIKYIENSDEFCFAKDFLIEKLKKITILNRPLYSVALLETEFFQNEITALSDFVKIAKEKKKLQKMIIPKIIFSNKKRKLLNGNLNGIIKNKSNKI